MVRLSRREKRAARAIRGLEMVKGCFADQQGICVQLLHEARWPSWERCIRCGHTRIWHVNSYGRNGRVRDIYVCKRCGRRFALSRGTIFENSHLSLAFWYAVIWSFSKQRRLRPLWIRQCFHVSYKTALRTTESLKRGRTADYFRRLVSLINREVRRSLRFKRRVNDSLPPEHLA